MNRFRSELRKIWTIRSTYALIAIMTLLGVGLISFFVIGYQNVDTAQKNPTALFTAIQQPMGLIALLLAIVTIISVGHEYRYNTILYSLTSARQRITVLLAKYAALLLSSLAIGTVLFGLCIAGFYAGQSVRGVDTIAQVMPNWDLIWRMIVLVASYVTIGFAIAVIFRSLIAAIAIMLIVPSTIESLLYLWLKENTRYLPFTALGNLVDMGTRVPVATSAAVVAIFIVVLLSVAGLLFQRRDAN